jgi:hypothetical protein
MNCTTLQAREIAAKDSMVIVGATRERGNRDGKENACGNVRIT